MYRHGLMVASSITPQTHFLLVSNSYHEPFLRCIKLEPTMEFRLLVPGPTFSGRGEKILGAAAHGEICSATTSHPQILTPTRFQIPRHLTTYFSCLRPASTRE